MVKSVHLLFWAICLVILVSFILVFRDILTPFVIGITVAYLLNPLVTKFEQRRLGRTMITIIILTLFFLGITLLLLLVVPPLYREGAQLASQAPAYLQQLSERLQPYFTQMGEEVSNANLDQSIRDFLQSNISNAFSLSSNLFASLLSGGQALIGFFSVLFITPLVAFFMMREWPAVTTFIDDLLPRHDYDELKKLLTDIDAKIAGFVRGQLLVALSLGIIYALALSLAGLEFGLLIGFSAGLLSIIPLFGSIVGLLVSVIVAWFQAGDLVFTGTIAGIFLVGQLLEGNVITPKLLGGSVGMHPLWILFSIMAGASLFGIIGMMISVPVAATLGVLIGFAVERYKGSKYYAAE